ncbi:hypothetical protein SAMN05444266_10999 [Chitinophaga jiangningensis]|uniref:Uncharacterized protein n=1 Tax=Chitinophaga jiangningensis TaxID=1419482 RepID=A0A1M7K0L9_9BACT|nr:hypothetical protein SAMN05444266_10999 [Chitinophaga jiangningensis]
MESFSELDLIQATIVITSLTHKCEKSLEKLTERNSQQTLLINRIKGLKIALALIQKEIEGIAKNR